MKISNQMLFICVSIFTLGLGACSFKKDEAKQKEAAKASAEVLNQYEQNQDQKKQSERDGGKLTDENVSVEFLEMEQPGYYKMRITWPASVPSMSVQVNDEFQAVSVNGNVFERVVMNDSLSRIHLTSRDKSGNEISRKEFVFRAPKDLLVNFDYSLHANANIEVNRVYFFRIFTLSQMAMICFSMPNSSKF